jgi:copper chaperone NosL
MRLDTPRWRPAPWLAALLLLGCGGGGPRPLVIGQDACDYCRMAITDARFGGEIVLTTGRHRTFDAIECLVSYLASGSDSAQLATVYVSDYEGQRLVDAATAVYLRGSSVRSPMGLELSAFAPGSDPAALVQKYGGTPMTWAEIRAAVTEVPHGAPAAPPPAAPGTAPPPRGRR